VSRGGSAGARSFQPGAGSGGSLQASAGGTGELSGRSNIQFKPADDD